MSIFKPSDLNSPKRGGAHLKMYINICIIWKILKGRAGEVFDIKFNGTYKNKLIKLRDAIAISKSETINH